MPNSNISMRARSDRGGAACDEPQFLLLFKKGQKSTEAIVHAHKASNQ
jgi:hypothetical protein